MGMHEVEIKTRDGVMDAKLFHPEGAGAWPAAIVIPDAGGSRLVFERLAERLAARGYTVLLPNVYYREVRAPVPEAENFFKDEAARKRILGLMGTLTPERVRTDAAAELDFLAARPEVKGAKVGIFGYCMGGGIAVRVAADFPERIAAAASFHGGRLATDAPDSPHRLVGKVRGELYFAHADQDGSMPAEAIATLEAALKEAGVRFRSELYAGARHGFTVEGSPAYDKEAADRHWRELLALFDRTLQGG